MSEPVKGFGLLMSSITFSGSVLSAIGSGFILLCYLALPMRRHFRHVLILNLAIADFVNSVNNSISGSYILYTLRYPSAGLKCTLNGLIGQVTVQAGDCAIFAIAIITVYTVTQTSHARIIHAEWEWKTILCVIFAIWILPFTTGFLALGKSWYGPVTGNWCWLVPEPSHLRFAMTHIWRYLFMICEVALYIALHFYLRRHFRRLAVPIVSHVSSEHSADTNTQNIPLAPMASDGRESDDSKRKASSSHDVEAGFGSPHASKRDTLQVNVVPPTPHNPSPQRPQFRNIMAHQRNDLKDQANTRQRAIQRVLLLNAYPLLYILLWIPGLANRIVEAAGGESRVTQLLQASTQFVGLANALTYGWNERIWKQLRMKYCRQYPGSV
ncbi:hypothetical protein HGRIS_007498 [Hohenbuehelia grisea]|uniref:G-protein coupled receptors family 1 profile domain-containing protein n=1 Tax=Hohenbuehelia grisea TaxID=104357 RepID=A0ABR3J509_9AGAR